MTDRGIKYSVDGSGQRFDAPSQSTYGDRWWLIADDLATDYHDNHDGWESSWPIVLTIYRDGCQVARFSVEREMKPTFRVYDMDTDHD